LPSRSSTSAVSREADIDNVNGDQHWRAVEAARVRGHLTVEELWLRYFAGTGDAGPLEVEAFLNGLMPLSPHQHDVLACAVNERLDELDLDEHVPYELGRRADEPPRRNGEVVTMRTLSARRSASRSHWFDQDKQLLESTALGDQGAAIELFNRYADLAYRAALFHLSEPVAATSAAAAALRWVCESPEQWYDRTPLRVHLPLAVIRACRQGQEEAYECLVLALVANVTCEEIAEALDLTREEVARRLRAELLSVMSEIAQ